jgi:hypothetical protein
MSNNNNTRQENINKVDEIVTDNKTPSISDLLLILKVDLDEEFESNKITKNRCMKKTRDIISKSCIVDIIMILFTCLIFSSFLLIHGSGDSNIEIALVLAGVYVAFGLFLKFYILRYILKPRSIVLKGLCHILYVVVGTVMTLTIHGVFIAIDGSNENITSKEIQRIKMNSIGYLLHIVVINFVLYWELIFKPIFPHWVTTCIINTIEKDCHTKILKFFLDGGVNKYIGKTASNYQLLMNILSMNIAYALVGNYLYKKNLRILV